MILSTLRPGNWPPSPGLAPCAILICRSSALTRYSVVTPKRPEATCLIAERIESPLGNGLKRCASSPPSPVLDLPPMRFIAIANVVCASRLIEHKLIAPVAKGLVIGDRVAAHRMLQFGDRLRRPGMILAAQSKGVIAAEIEHVLVERVVA